MSAFHDERTKVTQCDTVLKWCNNAQWSQRTQQDLQIPWRWYVMLYRTGAKCLIIQSVWRLIVACDNTFNCQCYNSINWSANCYRWATPWLTAQVGIRSIISSFNISCLSLDMSLVSLCNLIFMAIWIIKPASMKVGSDEVEIMGWWVRQRLPLEHGGSSNKRTSNRSTV